MKIHCYDQEIEIGQFQLDTLKQQYIALGNEIYKEIQRNCTCYVPEPGLYHGFDINRYLNAHLCSANIYYCPKMNGKPILLIDCAQVIGCYYQPKLFVDCKCKSKQIKLKAEVCGKELKGKCHKKLKYICNQIYPDIIGLC